MRGDRLWSQSLLQSWTRSALTGDNGKLIPIPGFQVWMDLSRPQSRGYLRLRSADPADAPSTVFNHMQCRQDMRDMIDGIRLTRTLVSQPALAKYRRGKLTPDRMRKRQRHS